MGLLHAPSSPPMSDIAGNVSSQIIVTASQEAHGHLHRIALVTLPDGTKGVLKSSPIQEVCLLRIEQTYLEAQAATLELLKNATLPIPRLLRHEAPRSLLMTRLPGVPYATIRQSLTKTQRLSIDKQIQGIQLRLSKYTSFSFGPVGLVRAGQGCKVWRDAFVGMVESILMDGEDIMSNLPYFQIREAIVKWESYLDDVTEARLVLPSLCKEENVLVDPETNSVTGLLDFGDAIWGDMAMLEGGDGIKGLLYSCYDSVLTIVRNHYRSVGDEQELEARKRLTVALRQLGSERS